MATKHARGTKRSCQSCDERVPLKDSIEQQIMTDPVARKILAMEEAATRQLDTQALEQILIGHMMAVCGEANQVFRPVSMFDYGIDGEIELVHEGQVLNKVLWVQSKAKGDSVKFVGETDTDARTVVEPILAEGYRGTGHDTLLVGGPETVIQQLREYRAMGFEEVMVRHIVGDHQQMLESFERIGRHVMPTIRGL